MPGKWQVRILTTLAQESPLAMQAIHARAGATTRAQRAACKRAARTLVEQGLIVKPQRGVYSLVVDVEVLSRAQGPQTALGHVTPRKETLCPGPS